MLDIYSLILHVLIADNNC